MAFWRTRTVKKKGKSYRYEELLESYRVPGVKNPRHHILKRTRKQPLGKEGWSYVATSMPFTMPLAMAYDLVTGRRVEELKQHLARRGTNAPTTPWGNAEWTRRVSLMSDAEWEKFKVHAKSVRHLHPEWSTEQRDKAARLGYLSGAHAREKEGFKVGTIWNDLNGSAESVPRPEARPSAVKGAPTPADEVAEAERKSYYHQTIETQLWAEQGVPPKDATKDK